MGGQSYSERAVARLAPAAVIALALRAIWLFVRYELGQPATHRYHAESATLALIVIGLSVRLWRRTDEAVQDPVEPSDLMRPWRLELRVWLAFCALAFVLYWPALWVGFLSDDYVLAEGAAHWTVVWNNPEFIRPLPLSIWAMLLNAGAGPAVFHTLNVALHATNACLTALMAARWLRSRPRGLTAGVLFLVFPLAAEPVVWCSGIFDLMFTTLALACVMTAAAYGRSASAGRRVRFLAFGLAALVTKETAVVTPLLVLADAWIRRTFPRLLARDTAVLFLIAAGSVGARLWARSGMHGIPLNWFVVQRGVFEAFGALAVPFHNDIGPLTVLSISSGVLIIMLATVFFLRRDPAPAVFGATAWILASILPVLPILVVDSSLQASRYLYLGTVGWSVVLVMFVTDVRDAWPRWNVGSVAALGVLIGVMAVSARIHERHWREAGALRDMIERAAVAKLGVSGCGQVTLHDLPDQVRGAYLFRNGAREAFAHDLGISATVGDAKGPCSFRWDSERFSFEPADR